MNRHQLSDVGRFHQAVRYALAASVAGTGTLSPAVLAQEASTDSTTLDTIEITGSRIRRVDTETASPIFTIDRATIAKSGVQTVADLIQELPAIAGAATNPRVNNGGGSGAAVISLRGLGEQRTLVLLNGRRLTPVTGALAEGVDINQIAINLIERVEVLKEGASAIYGSDAIGGVVNLITRRDFTGGELSLDTGVSSESDGERKGLSLSWGAATPRANVMVGFNYHDQEGISAGDREFSVNALYLYGGVVSAGGSSRVPTGRMFLPRDQYDQDTDGDGVIDTPGNPYNCPGGTPPFGAEISVTRTGDGDALGDYRCFSGGDLYNYQPLNLILTPQERANLFTVSNFKVTDSIEAYTEIFYNNTRSGFQIAPLPFDTRPDNVVISTDSIYNPFGTSFGGADAANPNATFRLEALGNRRSDSESNTGQINLGLKGDVLSSLWRWNGGVSYGRTNTVNNVAGYLFQPAIQAAVGPSFRDDDNTPYCGTPGTNPADPLGNSTPGDTSDDANVVAGCTPVNIFNLPLALTDPAQAAQFAAANAGYSTEATRSQKIASLNFDGPIFAMPAGTSQLAVGIERREQRLENTVDFLATGTPPDFLTCGLSQETCTNATEGSVKVTEFYAEVFLPLVADVPGAKALNAIIGTRYSDYNRFGSTDNSKIGIEYRPIDDLLVRASWAEVFRAPTITDLFLSITANAPTFTDPCTGLTQAQLDDTATFYELACENVAPDTGFVPDNGQVTGRFMGNPNLEPETGTVLTWGAVYDPDFIQGLSVTVDFWNYQLEETLEFLDVNTTAAICVNTGFGPACDLINRFPNGQVEYIDQPAFNLGEIDMNGVDVGIKYQLDGLPIGRVRLGVDTTYIDSFERNAAPGFTQPTESAGKFSRQDGNFARVRALGFADWSHNNFSATVVSRYVHGFTVEDADGNPPGGVNYPIELGSTTYWDVSAGYDFAAYNSKIRFGLDNVADKQPQILYQNNVLNANTDVETFDTVGRYMWVKFTQNF